jgi:hypothetical protein
MFRQLTAVHSSINCIQTPNRSLHGPVAHKLLTKHVSSSSGVKFTDRDANTARRLHVHDSCSHVSQSKQQFEFCSTSSTRSLPSRYPKANSVGKKINLKYIYLVYNCNNTADFTVLLSAYFYTLSPPYLGHLASRKKSFYNPYQTHHVFFIIGPLVVISASRASLNLWPVFCVRPRNRWQSLRDEFPSRNQNSQSTVFKYEIGESAPGNLFSDGLITNRDS